MFHLANLLKGTLGAGHMGVFSCGETVILVKEMSAQWRAIAEKAQYSWDWWPLPLCITLDTVILEEGSGGENLILLLGNWWSIGNF